MSEPILELPPYRPNEWLRPLRLEAGLTMGDLARELTERKRHVFRSLQLSAVSVVSVSSWENGKETIPDWAKTEFLKLVLERMGRTVENVRLESNHAD